MICSNCSAIIDGGSFCSSCGNANAPLKPTEAQAASLVRRSEQRHGVPALLSFFFPGVGQLIKGNIGTALQVWIGTALFSVIAVAGLWPAAFAIPVIWVWQLYDAYVAPDGPTKRELDRFAKMGILLLASMLIETACSREVQEKQPIQPPFKVQMSGVRFVGDEAVECIDMTATADPSNISKRPAADRAKAEQLVADELTSRLKKNGVVPIQQTCGEQFGGRPLFARCVLPPSAEGPLTVSLQTSFLSFDFVSGNYQTMKDCLSVHGRWNEMPRDSSEFIQAKLRHDSKALQRLAGVRQ